MLIFISNCESCCYNDTLHQEKRLIAFVNQAHAELEDKYI